MEAERFIIIIIHIFLCAFLAVLVYHVPQFLERFGTIYQFYCLTMEEKNHLQNRAFRRNSQKGGKGSNFTVQVKYIKLIIQCHFEP